MNWVKRKYNEIDLVKIFLPNKIFFIVIFQIDLPSEETIELETFVSVLDFCVPYWNSGSYLKPQTVQLQNITDILKSMVESMKVSCDIIGHQNDKQSLVIGKAENIVKVLHNCM